MMRIILMTGALLLSCSYSSETVRIRASGSDLNFIFLSGVGIPELKGGQPEAAALLQEECAARARNACRLWHCRHDAALSRLFAVNQRSPERTRDELKEAWSEIVTAGSYLDECGNRNDIRVNLRNLEALNLRAKGGSDDR